jgi:hypothetical protein
MTVCGANAETGMKARERRSKWFSYLDRESLSAELIECANCLKATRLS